jgi:hypothetical protein
VWAAFNRYQQQLGGDPLIGRRLYRLFHLARFSRIELSVQPEIHWHGRPSFEPWVRNIAGNIESAREGLVRASLCDIATIDRAIAELNELLVRPDASSQFMWNRVTAW